MDHRRVKVSVTLSGDLVEAVDAAVDRDVASSRSAVIEKWLRRARRADAEDHLREATVAYYKSLSNEERDDDMAIARGSKRAARRLRIDE